MNFTKHVSLCVVGLFCVVGTLAAEDSRQLDDSRSRAEIRISLPAGSTDNVSVKPGDSRVVLELPRGSVFPLDFAATSGGLLRGGEVAPLGADRVRLELELAQGFLEGFEFEAGVVLLRFRSRFAIDRIPEESEGQYLLGPDDKIAIIIHNHPELTSRQTISRGGLITAPLVGDVRAGGLSPRQLAGRLSELLGRDYLVNPQVDVSIEEYRSQWVMVSGEVRLPGRVPLTGGTRLKEALSQAGGFSTEAGERITISHQGGVAGGEQNSIERQEFGRGLVNPILENGDIVEVSRVSYCFVNGEVRNPSRVRVERGMTLLRALTIVGGLTEWADRKSVTILPGPDANATNGHPEAGGRIYNVKRIMSGKEADPQLREGEIVIVKRRFF